MLENRLHTGFTGFCQHVTVATDLLLHLPVQPVQPAKTRRHTRLLAGPTAALRQQQLVSDWVLIAAAAVGQQQGYSWSLAAVAALLALQKESPIAVRYTRATSNGTAALSVTHHRITLEASHTACNQQKDHELHVMRIQHSKHNKTRIGSLTPRQVVSCHDTLHE